MRFTECSDFCGKLRVLELERAAMPEERTRVVILREMKLGDEKLAVLKRQEKYAGLNGSELSNNDPRV